MNDSIEPVILLYAIQSVSNQGSGKVVHCGVTTTNCDIKSNQGLLKNFWRIADFIRVAKALF